MAKKAATKNTDRFHHSKRNAKRGRKPAKPEATATSMASALELDSGLAVEDAPEEKPDEPTETEDASDAAVIPLPKMPRDEIDAFSYPAREALMFARAIVGDGRGWQRRFAAMIAAPAKHIVNLSWHVRVGKSPNIMGAPAVRCAMLAKRVTEFAGSTYMGERLARVAQRQAKRDRAAGHNGRDVKH